MKQSENIPKTQSALQLTGPGRLTLKRQKPVHPPGPRQVLARVEAVGLCFSDMKLINQFDAHPRKGGVLDGLSAGILAEIPSYVPGEMPTVPGHEAVCRIVAVGEDVRNHTPGQRVLVQSDYRALRTAGSNAAFGYNFEGALQQYVLVDERVAIDPETGESLLIGVGEGLSASAVALVEPWACVANSYAASRRRAVRPGGEMLVVTAPGREVAGLEEVLLSGAPARVQYATVHQGQARAIVRLDSETAPGVKLTDAADGSFDDIIYFGSTAETIEVLSANLAPGGILNVVTGGRAIDADVSIPVGRAHYGGARWIGTTGASAAAAYSQIPRTSELRPGERLLVLGAAGPMGQMHVIRALASGIDGLSITAVDVDGERLSALARKVAPLLRRSAVKFEAVDTSERALEGLFTYIAVMAPLPQLVREAVNLSGPGAIINIFAGIPPGKHATLDLNHYIANGAWMFGTSGSLISDMKAVLAEIDLGRLDTDMSVDAVSGMAGAAAGLEAVANRSFAGKIVVYPALGELGLVPLGALGERFPSVGAALSDGRWTRAAERALLAEAD